MKKEYTVTARISGWRAVRIKAETATEAMKLARKLPAEKWVIGNIHISNDLKARQSHKMLSHVNEVIKNRFIEKMLN